MTKQEKIKEAYGELYERIKQHVDQNGWVRMIDFNLEKRGISYEMRKERNNVDLFYYNRPIALKGIESNNGWTKIESVNELPTGSQNYYVRLNDGRMMSLDVYKSETYYNLLYNRRITHYHPAPELPIY